MRELYSEAPVVVLSPSAAISIFADRARALGAALVLFSPSRDADYVRALATKHGLGWFTLPIARPDLARILAAKRWAVGQSEADRDDRRQEV